MALRYTLTFVNIPKNQEENPIFDSLSAYINNIASKLVVNDVSPFDLTLSTSCKIQLTDINSFVSKQLVYNYCQVTRYSTTPELSYTYYFWVKRNTRLSNNVIQFDMEMDTLNTFKSGIETSCNDSRNLVDRCHIDRFTKSTIVEDTLIPVMDKIEEGMSVPLYLKTKEKIEMSTALASRKTYIMMSKDSYSPIEYSYVNEDITYKRKFIGSNVNILMCFDVPVFARNSNGLRAEWDKLEWYVPNENDFYFTNLVMVAALGDGYITPYKDIDKTCETIIKIKELPYPPIVCNIATSGDQYLLNIPTTEKIYRSEVYLPITEAEPTSAHMYDEFLHGIGYNLAKTNTLQSFNEIVLKNKGISPLGDTIASPTTNDLARNRYMTDPKLFTSEFHTYKFAYYNDSYEAKLENFTTNFSNFSFNIGYKVTQELSLDFYFHIYPALGTSYKYQTEDYEGYMIVEDAPEKTLVSDSYIEYMRNGYNYDTTTLRGKKESAIMTQVFGLAGKVAGEVGQYMSGGSDIDEMFSNAPEEIFNFGKSVIRQIYNFQNAERNIRRKTVSKAVQSPALTNTKNGELVTAITGNRIYYIEYAPTDYDFNFLNYVLYLTGYHRGLHMAFPYNTRYWFNYCKGDIHLERRVPEYAIPDIKAKFNQGVTFYHYHNNTYDFEQEKENWEVSLL